MSRKWYLVFGLVLLSLLMVPRTFAADLTGLCGYNRGFIIQSEDGLWQLKITGYLRPVFTYRSWEVDTASGTDDDSESWFRMVNTYVLFAGQLGSKNVKYGFGYDFTREPNLLDAYIDLIAAPEFGVRLGQAYTFFSRSDSTSTSLLQFVSRDIATSMFNPSRDLGIMPHGTFMDGKVEYQVGLYNGGGVNTTSNADDKFLFVGRLAYMPFGAMALGEGAVKPFEHTLMTVGAKMMSNRMNYNADTDTYTDRADFGLEFALGWQSLFAQAEFFVGTDEPKAGEDTDRTGFYAQAGYFVTPKLEVAARFASISLDYGDSTVDTTQATGGIGYYWDGHFRKFQINGTMTDTDNAEETKIEMLYQIRF